MSSEQDRRLYGRHKERALIAGLLGEARQGHSGVLVVRGESGIGKSTLLADAAEKAGGFCVLRAAGVESEVELAFAPCISCCGRSLTPWTGCPARRPARCGARSGWLLPSRTGS